MGTMVDGVTNPVHATTRSLARGGASQNEEGRPAAERAERTDAVELSAVAREQMGYDGTAPVRRELVERIRAEIAAGTYLTDEKIDVVVDRLHRDMIVAA